MATTTLFGPFPFDFGPDGLAPGNVAPTVWNIVPPFAAGTVTFTAIPAQTAGADGARRAIHDPTVRVEAGSVGGSTDVTLHADVANVGQNTVFNAAMFISVVAA